MRRFHSMRRLQKFTAVHAPVCNYFNQKRALYSRDNFKLKRATALARGTDFGRHWFWHLAECQDGFASV